MVHAQYGTLFVTDSYLARDLTKEDAQKHLSYDFLAANIFALCVSMVIGYLSDKLKISKILNFTNLILVISCGIEVYMIYSHDLADAATWLFDLAFVVAQGFYMVLFMLSMTMLAKMCSSITRGTMFSFNSIFGSFGVLLIQLYGGYLYSDKGVKGGPFLIGLISISINMILTLAASCSGKFKQ